MNNVDLRNTPVELQLPILGIDPSQLKEKVTLDLGCGLDANLVRFMRKHGVNAYGIDPDVRKNGEEYLWKEAIYERYNLPLGDGSVNLVTGFQVDTLNLGLVFGRWGLLQRGATDFQVREIGKETRKILSEIERVLIIGGEFVHFPHLFLIEDELKKMNLTNLKVTKEKVKKNAIKYYFWKGVSRREVDPEIDFYRTRIRKS